MNERNLKGGKGGGANSADVDTGMATVSGPRPLLLLGHSSAGPF